MESQIVNALENALDKDPLAKGVLCVDSMGMCIAGRGTFSGSQGESAASVVGELARLALKLEPNSKLTPVITLDYDDSKILISKVENTTATIAIHRSNST